MNTLVAPKMIVETPLPHVFMTLQSLTAMLFSRHDAPSGLLLIVAEMRAIRVLESLTLTNDGFKSSVNHNIKTKYDTTNISTCNTVGRFSASLDINNVRRFFVRPFPSSFLSSLSVNIRHHF